MEKNKSIEVSIDEIIFESAKQEFLEKGYIESSLRTIAKKAELTTGAIYKRYSGKEELFQKVVEPALDIFDAFLNDTYKQNEEWRDNNEMHKTWDMSLHTMDKWIRNFYSELESMKILLSRAEASNYSNFLHDFVEKNAKLSFGFIEDLKERGISKTNISYKEYHIMLTSFWTCIFEAIIHDICLEEALLFFKKVNVLFNWREVLGF